MANPYQLSSIRTNLDSLRNIQGMDRQQAFLDVLNQKQKIKEDYEKDVEAIQKDARDRGGKYSDVLKGIKGITNVFGGPLANAIVGGFTSGVQLKQQKSGAKMLQNKAMDRYSRNFLSQQSDAFKEQADEAQLSSGDVLRGAFTGGLTSYLGSKMMGGEKGSSMFKKWREGRAASKYGEDILQVEKKAADLYSQDLTKDVLLPEGLNSRQKWIQETLKSKGVSNFAAENYGSIAKAYPGIQGSNIPGFENLYQAIEQGGDISDVSEKLQGALKIPNLLQLLLGL